MSRLITAWLVSFVVLGCCTLAFSQGTAQSPAGEKQTTSSAATDTQEKNVEEYIELLRTNVRQEKDQIMGALIGGLAGGGRGVAIGAAAGGAAGTTVAAATPGRQVAVVSESLLEFRLQQPTSLPVSR
jgi:uncharacterized protein YcfJ